MKKFLSILLFTTGFIIISFYYPLLDEGEKTLSSKLSPDKILSNSINRDLIALKNSGDLPIEWSSIKKVNVNTESINTSNINLQLEIPTSKDGQYLLECTVLNENPSKKNGKYLVKFSIYNKHNNQVWETFRFY